jgi:hypothetical protein
MNQTPPDQGIPGGHQYKGMISLRKVRRLERRAV